MARLLLPCFTATSERIDIYIMVGFIRVYNLVSPAFVTLAKESN